VCYLVKDVSVEIQVVIADNVKDVIKKRLNDVHIKIGWLRSNIKRIALK